MVAKLGNREDPLPQDSFEGVDEDEWVSREEDLGIASLPPSPCSRRPPPFPRPLTPPPLVYLPRTSLPTTTSSLTGRCHLLEPPGVVPSARLTSHPPAGRGLLALAHFIPKPWLPLSLGDFSGLWAPL